MINPPKPSHKSVKPSHDEALKRECSAVWLLDWAYRRELVRCAGEEELSPYLRDGGRSSWGWVMGGQGRGSGTVNGRLDCHEDALRVHAFVLEMFRPDWRAGEAIMIYAEKGLGVPERLDLPALRPVPKTEMRGGVERAVMRWDIDRKRNKEPIACEIEWVGVPEDEQQRLQARQRAIHEAWVTLLASMQVSLKLDFHKIATLGIDEAGRIIDRGVNHTRIAPKIRRAAASA